MSERISNTRMRWSGFAALGFAALLLSAPTQGVFAQESVDPVILQDQLDICKKGGDPIERETSCLNVIAANPEDTMLANAWFSLGVFYQNQKRYDLAGAAYDEAQALRPNWSGIYFNRALMNRLQGKNKLALKDLETAVQKRPTYARAWLDMAYLHGKAGRYEKSNEAARNALAGSNPPLTKVRQARAYGHLGVNYLDMKRYDEALENLQIAVRLNPRSAVSMRNMVRVYIATREYELARETLNRAIKVDPKNRWNKTLDQRIKSRSGQ